MFQCIHFDPILNAEVLVYNLPEGSRVWDGLRKGEMTAPEPPTDMAPQRPWGQLETPGSSPILQKSNSPLSSNHHCSNYHLLSFPLLNMPKPNSCSFPPNKGRSLPVSLANGPTIHPLQKSENLEVRLEIILPSSSSPVPVDFIPWSLSHSLIMPIFSL